GKSGNFPSPVLNLSNVAGVTGFKIRGESAGDMAGVSVAAAGDFNRDGHRDLVIGAPGRGAAYVLLGTTAGFADVVNLADVTESTGLKLQGPVRDGTTGSTVAAA